MTEPSLFHKAIDSRDWFDEMKMQSVPSFGEMKIP